MTAADALTMGSLFAGIGGFELAAEHCGIRTVWQSEIDPYCTALLAERYPGVPNLGDITTIDWRHVERPDIICGGFPCQDISYAGRGAGLAGERSGLWYQYARAIREMGPRYVVVENVRALLTRGFDAVLGTLADLGYDAEWSVYGAADVGAPHLRKRVWILAYPQGAHGGGELQPRGAGLGGAGFAGSGAVVADASGGRCGGSREGEGEFSRGTEVVGRSSGLDDSAGARRGVGRPESGGPTRDEARWEGSDGRRGGVGNTESERLGEAGGLRRDESSQRVASGRVLGWSDAVPVRGHDGTVRLIPRQAAEEGTESALRALVNGFSRVVAGWDSSEKGEMTADASKEGRIEAMRIMWGRDGAQAIQRQAGGCVCVCAEAVLLSFLCEHTGTRDARWREAAGGATPQGVLRELRCDHGARCTSSRPEPLEQLARELADRVSHLAHEMAPQAAEAWDRYSRSRANLWPVSVSSPGRVARLRGIGNAIVPACAVPIFRRIWEIEGRPR